MNKQTTNSTELLRRIERFCADADYTADELREQMIMDGTNPDKLVAEVKNRLKPIFKFKEPSDDAPQSVYILTAIDDDYRVRECFAVSDADDAIKHYHKLQEIWGGHKVCVASREINDVPKNLV